MAYLYSLNKIICHLELVERYIFIQVILLYGSALSLSKELTMTVGEFRS